MNIDPEELKPRAKDYFEFENGVKVSDLVSTARYDHFNKKRNQSLAILKVRMEDLKSGEMFSVSLN